MLSTSLNADACMADLSGERVALVGRLVGMSKRDAARAIREAGGDFAASLDERVTLAVVGEAELPLSQSARQEAWLDPATRKAADQGTLVVIWETELWQRLGLVPSEGGVRQLYTPAMLADLVGVRVEVVRRWHRRGLIVPAREVHRLPYYDFQEVATARRLAELLASGCSPQMVERQLAQLARYLPGVERPLAQLSVIVEGKQLLLRQGDGLIEPGGQLRIDFDSLPDLKERGVAGEIGPSWTVDEILAAAADLEDSGELAAAADMYRAALAGAPPTADVHFALAETLYRMGDATAARERYYCAIELDEEYVEARANLGCVLAELGETELALAAFEGALAIHDEYPDVHYHLAQLLSDVGNHLEAAEHWRRFLQLAPSSPWAEEARQHLQPAPLGNG